MDATEFITGLEKLSGDDLLEIAQRLRAVGETADGEVGWWRATITVSQSLKRLHRGRDAAVLAHRAVEAVQAAASRAGFETDRRQEVTAVARAAADVARALVSGSMSEETDDSPCRLLAGAWAGALLTA